MTLLLSLTHSVLCAAAGTTALLETHPRLVRVRPSVISPLGGAGWVRGGRMIFLKCSITIFFNPFLPRCAYPEFTSSSVSGRIRKFAVEPLDVKIQRIQPNTRSLSTYYVQGPVLGVDMCTLSQHSMHFPFLPASGL